MGDLHARDQTVGTVKQAILALYGSQPETRQAATLWLNEFSNQPSAWEICVSLLDHDNGVEVQFFCANMLLTKVRNEWTKLPEADRSQVTAAVHANLQSKASLPALQGNARLVLQRLSMVAGAIAALSGGSVADNFVRSACHMAANNTAAISLSLELLTSVAETSDGLDRARRTNSLTALAPHAHEVFQLVGAVLSGALRAPDVQQPVASALKCFSAWLKLDPAGGGYAIASPGELYGSQAELFERTLGALGSEDSSILDAATDALTLLLGPGRVGAEQKKELAALQKAMTILSGLQPRITGDGGNDEIGRHVARVAATLADREPAAVAGAVPEALPLAQLLLACLARPERSVAEAACEFFEALSTVPMAERHPQLRGPLYSSMLGPLASHARFPEGFTNWAECVDDEEDAFHRFREQTLLDALGAAYGVLRAQYLQHFAAVLSASQSWQESEAALFALRCVAQEVKARILNTESTDPSIAQDKEETRQFLAGLFQQLCSEAAAASPLGSHGWLAGTAARLIGEYAHWFGKAPGTPLEGALKYLLRALAMPEACKPAANAFRNLCTRCAWRLRNTSVLASLVATAELPIAPPPAPTGLPAASALEQEDRQAVAEGLARIVAVLPPGDASEAGLQLVSPFLQRAQHFMAAAPPGAAMPREAAHGLAGELLLVASSVRFMEFGGAEGQGTPPGNGGSGGGGGGPGQHPALRLLQAAWPLLTRVADSPEWRAEAEVVAALCEVYQRTLHCLKEAAAPLLPALLAAVTAAFQAHRHPPCLEVLGTAAEYCGAAPQGPQLLGQALAACCRALAPAFQAGDIAGQPDLLAALFDAADRTALLAPAALLASGALPPLLLWATRCSAMAEADPVRTALALLLHVLTQQGRPAELQQVFDSQARAFLDQHGPLLMLTLLSAATASCPRHLLRPLAALLHGLMAPGAARAEAARGWLANVLATADLPGKCGLPIEDCSRFCAAALRLPPMPVPRFTAMLTDFANIARGEATSDMLLGYEM